MPSVAQSYREFMAAVDEILASGERPVVLWVAEVLHLGVVVHNYGPLGADAVIDHVDEYLPRIPRVRLASRMGGDAWVVLAAGLTAEDVAAVTAALQEQLQLSYRGKIVHVQLVVGAASVPPFDGDARSLLRLADERMREAKHQPR